MTIRFVVSVAALAGLTACGGSGASNISSPVDLSVPGASYSDLDTAADFLTSYRTTADATSFSGTATYYGVILMAEDLDPSDSDTTAGVSPEGVVGQVELKANFNAATASGFTINGTATNFHQTGIEQSGFFEGNPSGTSTGDLSGTLNLSASERTDNFFLLTVDSGDVGGVPISGTFDDDAAESGRSAGFKSPDGTTPTALWVRTSDGDGLTVGGTPDFYDAVIAAD